MANITKRNWKPYGTVDQMAVGANAEPTIADIVTDITAVVKLMNIIGRKKSFMLGSLPLALSGWIGFLAVEKQSFMMLVISHSALGVYIALVTIRS